jgi:hypothetical protein
MICSHEIRTLLRLGLRVYAARLDRAWGLRLFGWCRLRRDGFRARFGGTVVSGFRPHEPDERHRTPAMFEARRTRAGSSFDGDREERFATRRETPQTPLASAHAQ